MCVFLSCSSISAHIIWGKSDERVYTMIQRYNDTIMDFMMDVQINLLSRVPIYVQVVDQIKHKIATGDLKPGDQLPTVRQLAAILCLI